MNKKRKDSNLEVVKVEEETGYKEYPPLTIKLTENERIYLLKELNGEESLADLFDEQAVFNEKCKDSIISKLMIR